MVTASTLNTHDELKSTKLTSRFSVDRVLGKGAFATVYAARPRISSRCLVNQSTVSAQHTTTISLKLVNVTKIAIRRRLRRKESDGNSRVTSEPNKYCSSENCGTGDDDGGDEYDTDQLFFPSRVVSKATPMASLEEDGDEEHVSVLDMLQREVSVHFSASSENHPNIVSMIESFRYKCAGTDDLVVAMVIEYCSRGDLHSYVKRKRDERKKIITEQSSKSTLVNEREVRHALRHILRGLAFLHSCGIVHRDIKAGNILISPSTHAMNQIIYGDPSNHNDGTKSSKALHDNGFSLLDCTLKIGDFGLAVKMSEDDDWDESQHTICGTPSCLAPEVALSTPQPVNCIKRSTHKIDGIHDSIQSLSENQRRDRVISNEEIRGHGQPADLWSVGCLLYALLVGRYPFSPPKPVLNSSRYSSAISDKRQLTSPKKSAKVQETISRSIKGLWCLPSELLINEPTKKILYQLLSLDPQKRGFARGLLSTHAYFKERKIPRKPLSNDQCQDLRVKEKMYCTPSCINTYHARTIQDKVIFPPSTLSRPNIQNDIVVPGFYNQEHGGIEANRNLYKVIPTIRSVHSKNSISNSSTAFRNVSKEYEGNDYMSTRTNGDIRNEMPKKEAIQEKRKDIHQIQYSRNEENRSTNVRVCSVPTSIHPTKLVNAICGIWRLPPSKYQWEELRRNKKGHEEKLMQYYSVFILPKEMGLVISCERNDGHGAWMHVIRDGTRISMGKLSKAPHKEFHVPLTERDDLANPDHILLAEAFLRCPKKAKQFLASSLNATSYPNEQHSLCVSATMPNDYYFNNTICSTESTHSLPTLRTSTKHEEQYEALSSLLITKNRPFLALYRRLERICNKVKQKTPKVTLYVHASTCPGPLERNTLNTSIKRDQPQVGRLLCKVILMDNASKPTVHILFIDNVQITYESSTGLAKLSTAKGNMNATHTLSFHFYDQNKGAKRTASSDIDVNQKTKNIIKHSSYIKFARVAVEKCTSIEHFYTTQESHFQASSMEMESKKKVRRSVFPIVKKMIALGKSCNEWIDATPNDGSSDEHIKNDVVSRESALKSYLIDDTAFSLPSMDILSSG